METLQAALTSGELDMKDEQWWRRISIKRWWPLCQVCV